MADLLEYKCPCCGGAIEFNSQLQKMKCPYCDTEFDVETLQHYDEQLHQQQQQQQQEDQMDWENAGSEWRPGESDGMRIYVCNSCGGEIVADENTAASSCPYCGNPIVMMGQLSGMLRPDYVIPFKLDKEAAKAGLMKHLSGKRLLPKVFRDQNHIDEIKGVYVPFWLFDADASAEVSYRATRIRTWSDRRNDYTETSFFSVFRAGSLGFNNVPVDGSSKMPDDLMESLEPFDFSQAVDFQTAYLAGYLADKYDVTAEQSIERANQRIKTSTEEAFRSTVTGFTSVVPESTNLRLANGKAKYALYPVWLLNTTWENKQYTFAMNGQTGKFVGDLPVDNGAYWRWYLLYLLIAAAIVFGVLWLFSNL